MFKSMNSIIKEKSKRYRKILFELCQQFEANTTNESVSHTFSESSDSNKEAEEAEKEEKELEMNQIQ